MARELGAALKREAQGGREGGGNRVGIGREREGEWNRVGVGREAGREGGREAGRGSPGCFARGCASEPPVCASLDRAWGVFCLPACLLACLLACLRAAARLRYAP